MKAFLDTNVVMDLLLDRQPFAAEAERLWFLAERGRITGFVSALSFPNVYCVARKARGHEAALTMLKGMRRSLTVVECDDRILQQAIDADFTDFEDAIQYYSAVRAETVCMISRNPRHFPKGSLPVLSPGDFFAAHTFE